ncbi:hypothetical protein [Azospirillum largimobile]
MVLLVVTDKKAVSRQKEIRSGPTGAPIRLAVNHNWQLLPAGHLRYP